jgi:hypothetical protein
VREQLVHAHSISRVQDRGPPSERRHPIDRKYHLPMDKGVDPGATGTSVTTS